MSFDTKAWLDRFVVPLLEGEPPLQLYSILTNNSPPDEVLVYLVLAPPRSEPALAQGTQVREDYAAQAWGHGVKRLLEAGFRFDYLREMHTVQVENQIFSIFGGDGSPLLGKAGDVAVRLFRKEEDGVALIVQLAAKFERGLVAAEAIKNFFALFEEDPVTLVQRYGARWGEA